MGCLVLIITDVTIWFRRGYIYLLPAHRYFGAEPPSHRVIFHAHRSINSPPQSAGVEMSRSGPSRCLFFLISAMHMALANRTWVALLKFYCVQRSYYTARLLGNTFGYICGVWGRVDVREEEAPGFVVHTKLSCLSRVPGKQGGGRRRPYIPIYLPAYLLPTYYILCSFAPRHDVFRSRTDRSSPTAP